MGTALAGLSIGVQLSGAGAAQEMELVVVATNDTDVNVRQIKA